MTSNGRPASRIVGTGRSVPERVLTNADLEKIVDTSDEWITTRTGIKERRIAEEGEATSDYAADAARKALDKAGIEAHQLDMIVIGTVTGDSIFPATAVHVQTKIGAKNAVCFDISAACSGFLYSLQIADMAIRAGQATYVLAIGTELLSTITNWEDRNTCVLFGDGAGAAVVAPSDGDSGILASYTGTNGTLAHLLFAEGGGSIHPAKNRDLPPHMFTVQMAGNEVFKHAVKTMGDAAERVMTMCDMKADDIDVLIPHQANFRIMDATAKRIHIPRERVFVNVNRYGNTSSASVPISLDEAIEQEWVKPGKTVLMVAFGGGFTWGSSIVRF